MAKRKRKATTAQLVDWRIGHHVEAAGKMIADALNRIADQMAADHRLQAAEVELRREHLLSVLESKAMADKAAQKIMGLMPDLGFRVHDLRGGYKPSDCTCAATDGKDCPIPFHQEVRGPEWVKDVLEEKP